MSAPVLYSFRRCPYAMRARLALASSGIRCELREVELKAKPASMLEASPKGTVPVLVLEEGQVLEESLDIMLWALHRHDPEQWLMPEEGALEDMKALIAENDGPFKHHLDRYKYPSRYEGAEAGYHRSEGKEFLAKLDDRLATREQLFGRRVSLADMAIMPFVRQFANTDRAWFDALPMPALQRWLDAHLSSERFAAIMIRHAPWAPGGAGPLFP